MRMCLRQVALVAADLEPVERSIATTLGIEPCFRDPGVAAFGLHNVLFPVGDQFLEVVAPIEDGTTAGRLLERRRGDGGYMVLLQVDDLGEMRRRIAAADVRVVFEAEAEAITGLHLHPRDLGGAIVSIDETTTALDDGEWPWAGPTWREHRRTEVVESIAAVDIDADDPPAMASRWAEVLGRDRLHGTEIRLDDGLIRFVPSGDRGEGVAGLELRGPKAAPERVLGGCRFRISGRAGSAAARNAAD